MTLLLTRVVIEALFTFTGLFSYAHHVSTMASSEEIKRGFGMGGGNVISSDDSAPDIYVYIVYANVYRYLHSTRMHGWRQCDEL